MSIGVDTSQKEQEEEFLTKQPLQIYMANGVRGIGSKMDTVPSVCLNQQLLDDLVAQCVSKVLTEDKFRCSLPVAL